MNTTPSVLRDERTVAVENASCRWSCIFLTYSLLIDVAYRGFFREEAAWDLLAMVIVSGGVSMMYQARQKALPEGWAMKALLVAFAAGVVAALVAAVTAILKVATAG
jgi:hypothetical protein